MKYILYSGIIIILISSMIGCNQSYLRHGIKLPKAIDEKAYTATSFQDYFDYYKYYYDENTIKEFYEMSEFTEVTEANIDKISRYMNNIKEGIKLHELPCKYKYKSFLECGNLFYLVEYREEGHNYPYQRYDLYYVDISECILHAHNICR